MAHSVQIDAAIFNGRFERLSHPSQKLPTKENPMYMAEHFHLDHSAPHGASRAATSVAASATTVSAFLNVCDPNSSAPVVSPSSPAFVGRRFLIHLSQQRLSASGLGLLAVLTLSFSFEARLAQAQTSGVQTSGAPATQGGQSLSLKVSNPPSAIASQESSAPLQAPRATLMPRSTAFSAPFFPRQSPFLRVQAALTPAIDSSASVWRLASTSERGSAKLLRLAQADKSERRVVTPLPPVSLAKTPVKTSGKLFVSEETPKLGATFTDFEGMKKIINVPSLKLPPLSKPLSARMQNASISIDHIERKAPTRLAQNPGAAPVRNPGAPVTNSDRLPNQIEVAVSTFVVLLTTTDLQTVAVADPGIADVAVVNSRSVLLNGKSAGVTSLVIVDGQKIRQYTVRVTPAPGSRAVDVATAIGLPGVTVRPLKDALVLEGEVASAEEARRANEIAAVYSAKVVNQLSIRGQVSQEAGVAAQLRDLINLPNINVRVSGETAILTGTVETPQQVQDADIIARTAAKNVINLLRLPSMTVDQVRESLGAASSAPMANVPYPGQLATSSPLTVREAGGQLVIEGTVGSQGEADVAIAAANRTGLPVINRLQVRAAATADQTLTSQVAAAIGRPGVIVRGTAKRLVLEGTVIDTNEAVLAEQVARAFVLPGVGQVDNMLRTSSPVQCNIDVSIVELNTTDARQLGVQYGSASLVTETGGGSTTTPVLDANGNPIIDGNGNVVTQTTQNGIARTIDRTFNQGVATAGNGLLGFGRSGPNGAFGFIDPFRARLNALINTGKGKVLSNPTTTVLSGRTATFQVGGQVPIPASSTVGANGTTTGIIFKDYGILLDIVPNALSNGNVTLRVRTEVSQPDFSVGVVPPGGGTAIPGFRRRSTVTEITVPRDGAVALSGLITSEDTNNETGVPILSKLPIIGALFRSRDFRRNKTELVIFVRPRVLPNPLSNNTEAFAGVMSVGENYNIAAQMGNPGLRSFDGGGNVGIVSNSTTP